jgi:hypothetical protein
MLDAFFRSSAAFRQLTDSDPNILDGTSVNLVTNA